MTDAAARRTSLYETHVEAGARLIDFAGWDMPVWYESATQEHVAVRTTSGLFDLGHMGELAIEGPDAGALLDWALLIDASAMPAGRARYTMICDEDGGIIDDLIVYRLADERFLVVANASNAAVVFAELQARVATGAPTVNPDAVEVRDDTDRWALIAVQGPTAAAIVAEVITLDVDDIRYYRIAESTINGEPGLVARTGYTGEDGFELFVPEAAAAALWSRLLSVSPDLVPSGLAARDTLRLEAGMPLYGNELTLDTTPFDVGAERLVKLDGPDFVGRTALAAAAEAGEHASLVGLHIDGRRPARGGYDVSRDGEPIGVVTSGTVSPTLDRPIAIARVTGPSPQPGDTLSVDVRGTAVDATVVELPFRPKPPTPKVNPD